MVQIGLLIMSVVLLVSGIRALMGKEKPGKETSPPVAIALIVVAVLMFIFALVVLPMLMAF